MEQTVKLSKITENKIEASGTISIEENGTYDVREYSNAEVNVVSDEELNLFLSKLFDRSLTEVKARYLANTTTLGDYIFSTTGLTSIEIPTNIKRIGGFAFYNCPNLKEIYYMGTVGDWCNIDFELGNPVRNNNIYMKNNNGEFYEAIEIEIPNTVNVIPKYAFTNFMKLTSVFFSDGITYIGDAAFEGCTSLTSIELSNSIKTIGISAFEGCTSLTSIVFRGTVEEWNSIYFYWDWNTDVPATYVQCTDGQVEL